MSRKIVSILALLCLLSVSNFAMGYAWAPNNTWQGTVDTNWFNPSNWSDANVAYCPPGTNIFAIIEPKGRIQINDGNATCSGLSVCHWAWSSSPDMIVDVNSGTLEAGDTINLAGGDNYNFGDNNTVGKAILVVHNGTVTTPLGGAAGTGLNIGGGGSRYSYNNYGRVTMYGGLISVPRMGIYHGDISLYGGTLEFGGDANFVFFLNYPENKIDISGGTLKLLGTTDYSATLLALRTAGRIFSSRGVIGAPVFDVNKTTITSTDNNMIRAWNPTPAHLATNIRHKDTNTIGLSWNEGDYVDGNGAEMNIIDHDVYFGANQTAVTNATKLSAEYKGTRYATSATSDGNGLTDPCTWTVAGPFVMNTSYYWRIDEVNLLTGAVAKGMTWTFKTHDGRAYNPKPAIGQVGLNEPLTLSWTSGDWTDATNGHKIYFATDGNQLSVLSPAAPLYRTTQTGTSYNITSLYPDFVLQPNTAYYWKVQEVIAGVEKPGIVWSFVNAPYVNIDDFEGYSNTDDVNANWMHTGYAATGCGNTGNSVLTFMQGVAGKYLQFGYSNRGNVSAGDPPWYFSEAKRSYPGGTSFTGGSALASAPKALEIRYLGTAINAVGTVYDRMYVAIEDTTGRVGVLANPDGNAAQVGNWTGWFSNLTAISEASTPRVDLNSVSGFAIGFGERCRAFGFADDDAGDGNVMFDNIRMYAATCVPAEGPTADLDEDCDVDINDMDLLANDWLQHADRFVYSPCYAPGTPVLWYKFNESGQDPPADSGLADACDYTGTVINFNPLTWSIGRGRDGNNCLYLPSGVGSYVEADANALDFMYDATHTAPGGGGITISVWINADMTSNNMRTSWNGLWGVWDGPVALETVEVHCPSPVIPPMCNFIKRTPAITASTGGLPETDFGGARWNHWAFVKEPSSMKVYLNGNVAAQVDANGQPGDPNANVYGPLFAMPAGSFRIGTRGGNWGMWNGRIDDFQVYDYALAAAEVQWLATDTAGEVFIPLVSTANINYDGSPSPSTDVNQIVNFGDIATMGQQWHTTQLWP